MEKVESEAEKMPDTEAPGEVALEDVLFDIVDSVDLVRES